ERLTTTLMDGVDEQRRMSGTWAFPPPVTGGPVSQMNNNAWRTARKKAADVYPDAIGDIAPWAFRNVRVHGLRHTFGRRLRAAGVPEETRKDLLGHATQSITTHYSSAEIGQLIAAVSKACDGESRPMLRIVG